jgi:hypothetical protein
MNDAFGYSYALGNVNENELERERKRRCLDRASLLVSIVRERFLPCCVQACTFPAQPFVNGVLFGAWIRGAWCHLHFF